MITALVFLIVGLVLYRTAASVPDTSHAAFVVRMLIITAALACWLTALVLAVGAAA